MRKRQLLKIPCLLFSLAALLVFTAFGLFDDGLFFRSDFASAFTVVAALAIPLCLLLAIPHTLLALTFRWPLARQISLCGRLFATLIAANLIYFILDILARKLTVFFSSSGQYYLNGALFFTWFILLVVIWILLTKSRGKKTIARRAMALAALAAPIMLLLFLGMFGAGKLASCSSDAAPKHVVMVVMDGWPAQFIRPFNHEAGPKSFDGPFTQALLFTNARSNKPYTSGFFSNLYTGIPNPSAGAKGPNLISALQRADVTVRTFSYHRNGMPESCGAHVDNYRGFRSLYLTYLHAPLLDWLGLEYTMMYKTLDIRNTQNDPRKQFMRKLASRTPKLDTSHNQLTDFLIPEMKRTQKNNARSFIIFHPGWFLEHDIGVAWATTTAATAEGRVKQKLLKREYRYDPTDEWFAKQYRNTVDKTMAAVADQVCAFLRQAKENGLLEDTLLILTADHGSIYSQGRFWYGYHPQEEAMRVPFVVFGAGKSGIDARNLDTYDITQTILNYFDCPKPLNPRARSFLQPKAKPCVTGLTLSGPMFREWYLIIYKENTKYLFNLHPLSDGAATEQKVSGFTCATIRQGQEVIRAVLPEFRQALLDHNLTDPAIHPNYRKAQLDALEKTCQ